MKNRPPYASRRGTFLATIIHKMLAAFTAFSSYDRTRWPRRFRELSRCPRGSYNTFWIVRAAHNFHKGNENIDENGSVEMETFRSRKFTPKESRYSHFYRDCAGVLDSGGGEDELILECYWFSVSIISSSNNSIHRVFRARALLTSGLL